MNPPPHLSTLTAHGNLPLVSQLIQAEKNMVISKRHLKISDGWRTDKTSHYSPTYTEYTVIT